MSASARSSSALVPSVARTYADVLRSKPADYYDYEHLKLEYGVQEHYELVRRIGRGKYSEVFEAVNVEKESPCVVKVLKAVKKSKIKREIKILQNLRGGPNIIRFFEIVRYAPTDTPALVTELVNATDHKTLYPTFTTHDIQYYMFRLLTALDYAHSNGIMHRDVKPHNVVIDHNRKILRLIDWGLADFYHVCEEYNCRVASRYFKAPELLLEYVFYDYSVDMWSLGCMLAAMIFRKDPFFQGADNNGQLLKIVKVLGTSDLLAYAKEYHIRLNPEVLSSVKREKRRSWQDFVDKANYDVATKPAMDLVDQLLRYDHSERLTARRALQHEYFLDVLPPSPDSDTPTSST